VRIASWNIRQGGGRRLGDICDALIGWTPDIVALQEVRRSGVGQVSEQLSAAGLKYSFYPETGTSCPGSTNDGANRSARTLSTKECAGTSL